MRTAKRACGSVRRATLVIELALVIVILGFVGLICVDFGRFVYHYVAVTNAARAGAEYAITNPNGGDLSKWQVGVQATARAELANQTSCDPTKLTTAVEPASDPDGLLRVKVTATYTGFRTVVPWPSISSASTLQSSVTMPVIR